MITGVHAIIYSPVAEEVRAFFRDVLEFPSVDAGNGWPIFALPPAELAAHPTDGGARHELYLLCDDLDATIAGLEAKGVQTGPVHEERWGTITTVTLPGGTEIGIYQPKHPRP